MAKAARAGATPHHRSLPNEIVIWEILVRLPPKSLLRCRVACRAWRIATSTHDFLLAHHARQPTLPLLQNCRYIRRTGDTLDITCFDGRSTLAADKLQYVVRLFPQTLDAASCNKLRGDNLSAFSLVDSCDGLLIFRMDRINLFILNPATRQYGRLPLHEHDFKLKLMGMYPHPPTGEYRLLLCSYDPDLDHGNQHPCHVLALGSGEPPRHVGWLDVNVIKMEFDPHLLFRGSMHWHPSDVTNKQKIIAVFDTISESFREMRAPVVADCADLFEMDGMMGMAIFDFVKLIDIWVLRDYEREVWAFNRRIELPVADIRRQCHMYDGPLYFDVVVMPADGELLVLIKFEKWLLHVGVDGKLVTTFHRKEVDHTYSWLKQTLVQHTFFPTLEGYVVNALPFM